MSQLTATDLAPLLDILQDPNHPAFEHALTRLTTFTPTDMTPEQTALLLARLETILAKLATESSLTAASLTKLRTSSKALQSYGNLK